LFAEPAFYSQVQVDAVNNTCVTLQNNLYVHTTSFAQQDSTQANIA
jgi:hypothetical protein